ncbi:MAG: Helix-turn-helix, type 11 domain protein [Nocardioides sp.]|nr:Helix-turn-helix, type 11 domain protein [Nocardioides sp.]
MARRAVTSVLSALGFTRAQDRLYRQALALSGADMVTVAAACQRSPEDLVRDLGGLVTHGIVRVEGERVVVLPPTEAVARMLAVQVEDASRSRERLEGIVAAIPFLTAAVAGPAPGEVDDIHPLDGEMSAGGDPLGLLSALIAQSKGDLLWWRPDQWRIPRESAMAKVVAEAVSSGRRSRAIYPARALREAPAALVARAEAGEQIRIVPELPSRLFIIGDTHVVLPEPLGFADEPRLLIRQRGLVEALTLLFELMWDRATPVPELDRGEARPDLRRLLLMQLADGAKDEQIARTLGISLRTVRRRIADLLIELGVDSRFQAGVEAVRRGWL